MESLGEQSDLVVELLVCPFGIDLFQDLSRLAGGLSDCNQ